MTKLALTLFIARSLGLVQLGQYSLVAGLASVLPVALGFGFSNFVGREIAGAGPHQSTPAISTYLVLVTLLYVFSGATLAVIGFPRIMTTIGLSAAILFLEHIQTDFYYLILMAGQPVRANLINLLRSGGWGVCYMMVAALVPSARHMNALLCAWLAGLLMATACAMIVVRRWGWNVRREPLADILGRFRHSRLLYLNDLGNTAYQYADRYVIAAVLGPAAAGIYVLYWSIGNALSNLISTTIVQVRRAQLVAAGAASNAEIWNKVRAMWVEASRASIVLAVIGSTAVWWLVPYLHRAELLGYRALLFPIGLALQARTSYEVLGNVFYARRRDAVNLYTGLAVLFLSFVLTIVLGSFVGIWGAAISLVAAPLVGAAFRFFLVKNNLASSEARNGL